MSALNDSLYLSIREGAGAAQRKALADLDLVLRKNLARAFHQLSSADIDDVIQEALIKVVSKIDTFQGRSKFTTWATSIAVNQALGLMRKRKRVHLSIDDAIQSQSLQAKEDAGKVVQAHQHMSLLAALIESELSERQSRALRAELGGMAGADVAEHMQITMGALYKLLHDARQKLRRAIEARGLTLDDMLGELS